MGLIEAAEKLGFKAKGGREIDILFKIPKPKGNYFKLWQQQMPKIDLEQPSATH